MANGLSPGASSFLGGLTRGFLARKQQQREDRLITEQREARTAETQAGREFDVEQADIRFGRQQQLATEAGERKGLAEQEKREETARIREQEGVALPGSELEFLRKLAIKRTGVAGGGGAQEGEVLISEDEAALILNRVGGNFVKGLSVDERFAVQREVMAGAVVPEAIQRVRSRTQVLTVATDPFISNKVRTAAETTGRDVGRNLDNPIIIGDDANAILANRGIPVAFPPSGVLSLAQITDQVARSFPLDEDPIMIANHVFAIMEDLAIFMESAQGDPNQAVLFPSAPQPPEPPIGAVEGLRRGGAAILEMFKESGRQTKSGFEQIFDRE